MQVKRIAKMLGHLEAFMRESGQLDEPTQLALAGARQQEVDENRMVYLDCKTPLYWRTFEVIKKALRKVLAESDTTGIVSLDLPASQKERIQAELAKASGDPPPPNGWIKHLEQIVANIGNILDEEDDPDATTLPDDYWTEGK